MTDAWRVALLNPCFWPEVQRGSERIVRDLASELAGAGHNPTLITSHPGPPMRSIEDGLPIIRHWRPPDAWLRHRKVQEYVTHVPFTYASLHTNSYDLAHAFYPTDALAAVRWARRSCRPVVFSYMGIPQRDMLAARRGRLWTLEEVTRSADAIVALSHAAGDGVRRWLGVEPHVIYPGVDLATFAPGRARAETPLIVCAADPDDQRKRVGLLLEALQLVRRSRPETRLALPIPKGTALAHQIRDLGDSVELFEPDSRPETMARLLRSAWVSVLPSYNEAFGLVIIEALACGTPAVGARDGGVPEIVNSDEIGRLFDGDEPAALARALTEALELSQDPRTGEACRRRAAEFALERNAQAHVSLYRDLVRRRSGH